MTGYRDEPLPCSFDIANEWDRQTDGQRKWPWHVQPTSVTDRRTDRQNGHATAYECCGQTDRRTEWPYHTYTALAVARNAYTAVRTETKNNDFT